MANAGTPVELEVTLSHVQPPAGIKEYILKKLERLVYSMPNLRSASVEGIFEHTTTADQRYVVQITLAADGRGTLVRQRMEYELKFGLIGKLMVRKKWDAGIKCFFAGLKHYVETGQRPPGKE